MKTKEETSQVGEHTELWIVPQSSKETNSKFCWRLSARELLFEQEKTQKKKKTYCSPVKSLSSSNVLLCVGLKRICLPSREGMDVQNCNEEPQQGRRYEFHAN
jgi:hypothetical protein